MPHKWCHYELILPLETCVLRLGTFGASEKYFHVENFYWVWLLKFEGGKFSNNNYTVRHGTPEQYSLRLVSSIFIEKIPWPSPTRDPYIGTHEDKYWSIIKEYEIYEALTKLLYCYESWEICRFNYCVYVYCILALVRMVRVFSGE